MNPTSTTESHPSIDEAIFSGNRIAAIRNHRTNHGSSLKDAIAFVDGRTSSLRTGHPDKFQKADPQSPDLVQEVQYWKGVAAYLATCHAATLEGLPKSAAARQRARQVSICVSAAKYLKREDSPKEYYGAVDSRVLIDAERCEKAAKNHA